jgi:hypothetical protein
MDASMMNSEVLVEKTRPSKPLSLWRQLGEDVRCVFERDPAARTRFEIMTTYPGVHAIDLNHHLIPGPVADAIACLLEREVGGQGCIPSGESSEEECNYSDAKLVCEPAGPETAEEG